MLLAQWAAAMTVLLSASWQILQNFDGSNDASVSASGASAVDLSKNPVICHDNDIIPHDIIFVNGHDCISSFVDYFILTMLVFITRATSRCDELGWIDGHADGVLNNASNQLTWFNNWIYTYCWIETLLLKVVL